MEKLQKALQQARESRERGAMVNNGRVAPTNRSAPMDGSPVDEAWNVLRKQAPDTRLMFENLLVSQQAQETAAPFDILRTKSQLMMSKNGWSRLAVTSPTAACGKTTMACNLALGFTRQSDIRVILFEMDLRRPSMARMLGMRPERDITEVMAGTADFAEQAIRLGDNVAISMARQPSVDPTAMFLSHKTHAVLAEIEQTYQPDIVIFDVPPLLVGDDTRAFLKEVDCALIVAKAEATSVTQIDTCEREVAEQTNVLGVVLNQCRHSDEKGYEGYYYG